MKGIRQWEERLEAEAHELILRDALLSWLNSQGPATVIDEGDAPELPTAAFSLVQLFAQDPTKGEKLFAQDPPKGEK